VRHFTAIVSDQAPTKILRATGIESTRIYFAFQHVNVGERCHFSAGRVVARAISVTRLKMSAFAKAPARQSTLFATLRAKTGGKGITLPLVHPIMRPKLLDFYLHTCGFGGKGIRTPDLLIANETLYQLSYTPEIFGRSPFNVQNLGCISTGGPPVLAPDGFPSVHSCSGASASQHNRTGHIIV
jgi:hypothetical protein